MHGEIFPRLLFPVSNNKDDVKRIELCARTKAGGIVEKHFLYFHDKLLTIFLFLYQHGNLASSFRSCEIFIFIIHSPEFPLTLLAEKLNGEVCLRGDSK